MSLTPPNNIRINSDGNELKLEETVPPNAKKKTTLSFLYRYTLSNNKLHTTLSLSEKELSELLRKGHANPF